MAVNSRLNNSRKSFPVLVHSRRAALKGEDVVAVMHRLHQQLGLLPERIQVDNGREVVSKALDRWAYDQHVTLDFSRPGRQTDNPYIGSFNGSSYAECLNVH